MSPFSFLARGNLADHAKQLSLGSYTPEITLEGLQTGVDNVRTDVYLSPRFNEIARQHLMRLLAKYGNVEDFLVEDAFSRAVNNPAPTAGRGTGFIGSPNAMPAACSSVGARSARLTASSIVVAACPGTARMSGTRKVES